MGKGGLNPPQSQRGIMSNTQDIGNLNNKEFGIDLDPSKNLHLSEDKDKGQQAFYKGNKMAYIDYIAEVGSRVESNKKGKGITTIGSFAGFGEGTLKKPYMEKN